MVVSLPLAALLFSTESRPRVPLVYIHAKTAKVFRSLVRLSRPSQSLSIRPELPNYDMANPYPTTLPAAEKCTQPWQGSRVLRDFKILGDSTGLLQSVAELQEGKGDT